MMFSTLSSYHPIGKHQNMNQTSLIPHQIWLEEKKSMKLIKSSHTMEYEDRGST